MPNMQITENQLIDAFVTQMLKDKGVLSDDRKVANIQRVELKEKLMDAVTQAAVDNLSEDQLRDLDARMSDMADSELDKIFSDEMMDKITKQTMVDFRAQYLAEGVVA